MAVVVCPNIPFSSTDKRDTFLSLLKAVAIEAEEKEQECLAYFWLRQTPGSVESAQTLVYLRGLEVYASDDALTLVHRGGEKYKHMREVAVAQSLFTYPKHGITLRTPAGIGFLSKSQELEMITDRALFSISDYNLETTGARETLMEKLQVLAQELQDNAAVLSFCTFCPRENASRASVTLLGRYASEHGYQIVVQRLQGIEIKLQGAGGSVVTGQWQSAGFGFIRSDSS